MVDRETKRPLRGRRATGKGRNGEGRFAPAPTDVRLCFLSRPPGLQDAKGIVPVRVMESSRL